MMSEKPGLWDTHAHLNSKVFERDAAQVIERALAAGISRIVTLGTDLESSRQAIRLSEAHPPVLAVVGWHPNDLETAPADLIATLRPFVHHPRVVALGEMGLDYYRLPKAADEAQVTSNLKLVEQQKRCFRQQLDLAVESGLSCVIHQRNALDDTLDVFRPYAGRVRAVFHCFAGDMAAMRCILDLGCLVSFTGIITYKNNHGLRDALAACPPDRFMLETDSPYLAPVPCRGQRCEPAMMRHTAELAAQIRHCSLDELAELTSATAARFFRLGSVQK
jgi:TatD DNase family protein